MTPPQFDPSVIERYAHQLYRKADSVRIGSIVVGSVLGLIFGSVPLTGLGKDLPVPASFGLATLLLGALVGAILGYAIGDGRAFRIRLQAQLILLQLERSADAPAPAPAASLPAPLLPVRPAAPQRDELSLPPLSPSATA
jgi:hypothetical protein